MIRERKRGREGDGDCLRSQMTFSELGCVLWRLCVCHGGVGMVLVCVIRSLRRGRGPTGHMAMVAMPQMLRGQQEGSSA